MTDTTAPTLTSLIIPTSINLTGGKAALTVSGRATDDASGVKEVAIWFDKSFAYSHSLESTSFGNYSLLGMYGFGDSWSDGLSTQTVGVASTNAGGIYRVDHVDVQDQQGNTRVYSSAQLSAMGVNTAINFIASGSDTSPTAGGKPTVTFTQGVEAENFVIKLFSSDLGLQTYTLGMGISYSSSTSLSFSKIEFIGSSATSQTASNVNGFGTVDITGQIASSATEGQPFATIKFSGTGNGVFNLNFTKFTLNGAAITMSDPPAIPYQIAIVPDARAVTPQTIIGTSGNDTLTAGPGNDTLNGGAGIDIAALNGNHAAATITKTSTGYTVSSTTTGTDNLTGIERLKFADKNLALDLGVSQAGGGTALLVGAVLGSSLMGLASKQALLGSVIDLFDQGYTLQQLSGAIMRLPIWDVLTNHAVATNTDIAKYLLTTVNRQAPDSTLLNAAVNALNTETGTAQGNFLGNLAASAANQTQIDLVGLSNTGLIYA